jgi:hypothetical protein
MQRGVLLAPRSGWTLYIGSTHYLIAFSVNEAMSLLESLFLTSFYKLSYNRRR